MANWIKVENRMPEVGKEVLCKVRNPYMEYGDESFFYTIGKVYKGYQGNSWDLQCYTDLSDKVFAWSEI